MWRYAVMLCAAAAAAEAVDLPENFIQCPAADASKLNECLVRAVPDALRKMKDGIPSHGIAPLEPLLVNAIDIDSGGGPVRISQNYRRLRLHGLTQSTLNYYKADLKHYRLRTESITPRMELVGDYIMKGRILLLPIQGKGLANITLVNLLVKHDLIGEPVMRDGQLYMHIKEYRVLFSPKKVHLYFGNLFNGDKLLGDQMNRFLNENSELVFNELKSAYEHSLSEVFRNVANQIFDHVPFNQIFKQ